MSDIFPIRTLVRKQYLKNWKKNNFLSLIGGGNLKECSYETADLATACIFPIILGNNLNTLNLGRGDKGNDSTVSLMAVPGVLVKTLLKI